MPSIRQENSSPKFDRGGSTRQLQDGLPGSRVAKCLTSSIAGRGIIHAKFAKRESPVVTRVSAGLRGAEGLTGHLASKQVTRIRGEENGMQMADIRKVSRMGLGIVMAGLVFATALGAAAQAPGAGASPADREFVGKVSQGGAYEVAAGRVAAMRGQNPFIKNFGTMETHDHEGVGAELKRIAGMTGVPIAPGLNAEFSARLAKLKSVPTGQFDSFYLADMKQIHNNDEGLFAQEANDGSAAYKDFAHNTAVLVKAHLGWLNTM